jgi:hypothetical protein
LTREAALIGLADEIRKLKELRDSGTLTEAEFAQAKATLLADSGAGRRRSASGSLVVEGGLGDAVKTLVKYQVVMAIVGVGFALVLFFCFLLPSLSKSQDDFDRVMKRSQAESNRSWDKVLGKESPRLDK